MLKAYGERLKILKFEFYTCAMTLDIGFWTLDIKPCALILVPCTLCLE